MYFKNMVEQVKCFIIIRKPYNQLQDKNSDDKLITLNQKYNIYQYIEKTDLFFLKNIYILGNNK